MRDDRLRMVGMRIRAAGVPAVYVIIAVVASAVTTCVPGAMEMHASQVASCAGMAGMNDEQPCVSSAAAADCCTHHEPSLTSAKADLLKSPLQHVPSWVAWMAPVVIVPANVSIRTAESPPE